MRQLIFVALLALAPGAAWAAATGFPLDSANIDPTNHASLQRGAKLYVNYCMGCHSMNYQRYNRVARDIGLTDPQMEENLIFTGAKVGDTMTIAMSETDAKRWFGAAPPDLNLIARSSGIDWLYTYLRTFYRDPSRPLGSNNAIFQQVGMPNVLWELQGVQEPVFHTETDAQGNEKEVLAGVELVEPGKLTAAEFDRSMRDLVNFLAYSAEPIKLERQSLGVWVLLFLVLMTVVFYLLKKEYWKDVH
jgi:ubiquinol-cytochrome c reductase cytochrome c1 subunit